MTVEWNTRIRCYVSPGGNNKIRDWYNGLSTQEKAYADEFIKNMRKTREWRPPNYRPRLGGGEGLGELRWESEGKRHRLLGFFMKGSWYAVVGCTHKQQVYNPPDAIDTAKRNKHQIERGEVETEDYDL
jgi:hypothetical protein